MKKIFVMAAAALLIGSTANAQDVMKQQGGERNLEVLFTPFGDSPIGINGIKYRSFTSATNAWRAVVSLDLNTTSSSVEVGDNEFESSTTQFGISVAPGYEWHFVGTDRLSPYVGAEVLLGFGSNSGKNDAAIFTDAGEIQVVELENSASIFNAGAGVFAGFDFYFSDNVYIGAELNYGLRFASVGEMTMDVVNGAGNGVVEETTPGNNSFGIGEGVVGAIRVGFLF